MNLFTWLFHNVLPFIIVLTPLIFVHELGHFLVARWNKVRVEVFSIGFGRELFGWNDRHGTRWKVSAVPPTMTTSTIPMSTPVRTSMRR